MIKSIDAKFNFLILSILILWQSAYAEAKFNCNDIKQQFQGSTKSLLLCGIQTIPLKYESLKCSMKKDNETILELEIPSTLMKSQLADGSTNVLKHMLKKNNSGSYIVSIYTGSSEIEKDINNMFGNFSKTKPGEKEEDYQVSEIGYRSCPDSETFLNSELQEVAGVTSQKSPCEKEILNQALKYFNAKNKTSYKSSEVSTDDIKKNELNIHGQFFSGIEYSKKEKRSWNSFRSNLNLFGATLWLKNTSESKNKYLCKIDYDSESCRTYIKYTDIITAELKEIEGSITNKIVANLKNQFCQESSTCLKSISCDDTREVEKMLYESKVRANEK